MNTVYAIRDSIQPVTDLDAIEINTDENSLILHRYVAEMPKIDHKNIVINIPQSNSRIDETIQSEMAHIPKL
jgi:hypothetical protein